MGVNIAPRSESWGIGKKDWIATRFGFDLNRSVTLNVALFNALHWNTTGYIPSGTVLGKLTATGLYGPYSPALANGLDTAAGFLFEDFPVITGTEVGAVALFWQGVVMTDHLPTFTGAAATLGVLDANGRADIANFIRFETYAGG